MSSASNAPWSSDKRIGEAIAFASENPSCCKMPNTGPNRTLAGVWGGLEVGVELADELESSLVVDNPVESSSSSDSDLSSLLWVISASATSCDTPLRATLTSSTEGGTISIGCGSLVGIARTKSLAGKGGKGGKGGTGG